MVNVISKKIESAVDLLVSHPQPLIALQERWNYNIRHLVLNTKNGNSFIYRPSLAFDFACIPKSNTSVSIFIKGKYPEEIESKICLDWLKSGDSCLDIGANIGYFSTLFASQVGETGKVIAVEASPQTSNYLQEAIDLLSLDRVAIEQICVTDKADCSIDFMVSKPGITDLKQSLKVSQVDLESYQKTSVQTSTIDGLITKYNLWKTLSLVKIDIEGAEVLALNGACNLFDRDNLPLFIVEIAERSLSKFDCNIENILEFFPENKFDLYFSNISHPNSTPNFKVGKLYPFEYLNGVENPWLFNLIAVPKNGKHSSRNKVITQYL